MNRQEVALADSGTRRVFEEELLFGEATDTIAALLQSLNIRRSELARRLRVSPGRVSQILSGGENLTLRTLGAIGWALGIRFGINPMPMANRVGTPAEDDPPTPEWLPRIWRQSEPRFSAKLTVRKRASSLDLKLYPVPQSGPDDEFVQAA